MLLYLFGELPGKIIAACLLALYIIISAVYPALEYIQWAYLITKDRIEIKKALSLNLIISFPQAEFSMSILPAVLLCAFSASAVWKFIQRAEFSR